MTEAKVGSLSVGTWPSVMAAVEASAVRAATLYCAMPVASTSLTMSHMAEGLATGSLMPSTPTGPMTPVEVETTAARIRLRMSL